MFEALRKMIMPIIIIVLVFFLGMIVLQWGLDLNRRPGGAAASVAGVIDGDEVPWNVYQQIYSNLYQNEAQSSDYDVPDERVRELEQLAWNQIVAERLLVGAVEEFNIIVTDEDVYTYLQVNPPVYLQQAPVFQTDGQFDYQKYRNLMADPQAAEMWASIEPQVRAELRKIKLQQLVMQAAHVSEAEVKQAFLDSEEKLTVGIINVRKSRFTSITTTIEEDAKKAYFEAHQDNYQADERVVLEVVQINKLPSELDLETARAQAFEIYDSVTSGSDFAEFARIFSDDPGTRSSGGDLGWFAPGRMVKGFDSAAFTMADGDISQPIKTSFGWHILKHQGYRQENDVQEAHVSHILVKAIASNQTLDAAWDQLDMVKVLTEDTDLASAAAEEGLEVTTTERLTETSSLPLLGGTSSIVEWALEQKVGTVSEVLDIGNSVCLVRVAEKIPAGMATYEEVTAQVANDVRDEQTLQRCRDTMQLVSAEIKTGASMADAAETFGLKFEELPPFGRSATVAHISSAAEVIGAAFAMKEPGQRIGPMDYNAGTVIMELISKDSPELTVYNEKRDSVYNAVLSYKQQDAYRTWVTALLENADVVSNINFERRR